jgi:hypothetical protein
VSPVVRVVAGPPPGPAPVHRVALSLGELVVAARLAGDVPLPFRPPPGPGRMAARLAGTRPHVAHERVAAELARADDPGPSGAAASLSARGLLAGDALDPRLVAVLHGVASAPLLSVLDVTALDGADERRVRAWWAAGGGALSGLVLRHPTHVELVRGATSAWTGELARLVPPPPGGHTAPARTVLPVEALLGALAVHRRGRADLVEVVAADHGVPDAGPLLHALGAGCRGRLRLLVVRRSSRPDVPAAVTVWVLLGDGWRSLRPVADAGVEVRRRRPVDLGLASYPWVRAVA